MSTNFAILATELYLDPEDRGNAGKLFECASRWFTSGRKPKAIKPAGKADAFITWTDANGRRQSVHAEYKCACGEVSEELFKADIVVYCPEPTFSIEAEDQGFVFSGEEFREMLNSYPGRGQLIRYNSKRKVYQIQSFQSEGRPKASRPIAEYLWNACYEKQTLREWLQERRGA